MHYTFKTKKSTFALVDKDTNKYLVLSFFSGSDGSGYLTINSSLSKSPDYMKFSFHPKGREFRHAITNEIWKHANRPNKERTKFIKKNIENNQLLVKIYIDRSALFRNDEPDKSFTKLLFPEVKPLQLRFGLEKGVVTMDCKAIDEDLSDWIQEERSRYYEKMPQLNTGIINGCAEVALDGDNLPLRVVVFGI